VTTLCAAAEVGTRGHLDGFGDRGFECIASLVDTAEDDPIGEPDEISYWASDATWDPVVERPTLVAVAEDRLRALWLNTVSKEVYAPYDGGADLILSTAERRDLLKQEFAGWLSARPDSL